jgi:hypothetical protein
MPVFDDDHWVLYISALLAAIKTLTRDDIFKIKLMRG